MNWKTTFSAALLSSAAMVAAPVVAAAMTYTETTDFPSAFPPDAASYVPVGTTRVEGVADVSEFTDLIVFPNVAAGDVTLFLTGKSLGANSALSASIGGDLTSFTDFITFDVYIGSFFMTNIGDTGSTSGTLFGFAGGDLGVYVVREGGGADYCVDIAGTCEGFGEATGASEPAAMALIGGAALAGFGAASRRRAKRR